MSRCLGCMQDVMLLSEIHPRGGHLINPLQQAQTWFGLFDEEEIKALLHNGSIGFAECMTAIVAKGEQTGRHPVIRDWNHMDFVGFPFLNDPGMTALTIEVLGNLEQRRFANIRNPIDIWLSMQEIGMFRSKLPFNRFAAGWIGFARMARQTGYVRFEDFCDDPAATMREFTAGLGVPFDPGFIDRYQSFDKITGDMGGHGSRGAGKPLQRLERRELPADLPGFIRTNPELCEVASEFGYDLRSML